MLTQECVLPAAKLQAVTALLQQEDVEATEHNNTTTTAVFALNGAFSLALDPTTDTATLLPTQALRALCPTHPDKIPDSSIPFPKTCVIRQEIAHIADTTFELGPQTAAKHELWATAHEAAVYMQSVLGGTHRSYQLGEQFSSTLASAHHLDGRSRRAWWINPGYEWVSREDAWQSPFSLSQHVVVMALFKRTGGREEQDDGANRRTAARAGGPPSYPEL
jgi:hypothetical protein